MSGDPSALRQLKEGIARAKADRDAPLAEGEIRQAFPLEAYFDDKATKAKWRLVSEIRVREKDLYNRVGNDPFLADKIVGLVEDNEALDWSELLKGLNDFIDESSEWIIAIPLANTKVEGYSRITDHVGIAEVLQDRDWSRDAESPVDRREIFDHLGDYIDVGWRWHRKESHAGELDGRRTAALVFLEQGAEPLALSVARSKARYALAMWCLLVPPEWRDLWPALADWAPRPHIERPVKRKKFEAGLWSGVRSPVRGGDIIHYQEYEAPTDPDLLRAPFRALERAGENGLAARAALSAGWSLYLAERAPADLDVATQDVVPARQAELQASCGRESRVVV